MLTGWRHPPETLDAVREQFLAGKSHGDIAKALGMKKSVVSGLCTRNGLLRGMRGFSGRARWVGRLSIPEHCHPLVRKLFAILNEHHVCIGDISMRSGIKPQTISNWRWSRNPTLPMFEAALNALGYELVIKPKRGE